MILEVIEAEGLLELFGFRRVDEWLEAIAGAYENDDPEKDMIFVPVDCEVRIGRSGEWMPVVEDGQLSEDFQDTLKVIRKEPESVLYLGAITEMSIDEAERELFITI